MPDRPLLRDQRAVTVGLSDTVIAPGNDRRRRLVISAPRTNRVTINFAGPAVLDQGINIHPGTLPLILIEEDIGQALREEIHAITTGGPETLGILDVFVS